jgi:hypothetical protein
MAVFLALGLNALNAVAEEKRRVRVRAANFMVDEFDVS